MRAALRTLNRRFPLAAASALALAHGCGEAEPPVIWTASVDGPDIVAPGSVVRVRVDATPTGSWYFYSLSQPAGGPVPARIWLADSTTFKPEGAVRAPRPTKSFDTTFGIDVEKYPGAVSFTLPVRVPRATAAGPKEIRVGASYQACNDTICLSPRTVTMRVPVRIGSP